MGRHDQSAQGRRLGEAGRPGRVESGRLVMESQQRPRYTLDELLAQCNPKAARTKRDREWVSGAPVGSELI